MLKNVSQCKDVKKWPTDANFHAPTSTGRKVEMASTNAGDDICLNLCLKIFNYLQVLRIVTARNGHVCIDQ